jgi:hypothetical protein
MSPLAVGQLTIRDYSDEHRALWDAFVARSKNGTFLFQRDYMDYHADRFPDASLLAFDHDGTVRALLPATRLGDELVSHAGLSYGGFVTDTGMTIEMMLRVFDASLRHLREAGIGSVMYKTVPHIYHRSPAEEDMYALFVYGAGLHRRDLLSVLDYGAELDWEDRSRWRMRKAGKARRAGFQVRKSDDWHRFWPLLTTNLDRRHGIRPVHTVEEIELLARRFPDRIELFGMYRDDVLEAGAVTYVTDTVCHAQYSASSDEGRAVRGLDFVFAYIIDAYRGRVRHFDFGISNEPDGSLNEGLAVYKERFGARAVVHDFYRLNL